MGFTNDTKVQTDEGIEYPGSDLRTAGHTLTDHMKDGVAVAKAKLLDIKRQAGWKTLLGAIAGLVVVTGVILMARRRARRDTFLQRGWREGSRYALLVPVGVHKAQQSAGQLAKGSARLWAKLPKFHLERN